MKRFLILMFVLLLVAPVCAQEYPESISGGYPVTIEGAFFAAVTEIRNTPWSMAPPPGDTGYIGHIEIIQSVSGEAMIIAIDWDPWYMRNDGTRLHRSTWRTRELFEWEPDCGCYLRELSTTKAYSSFESFMFVPAWVEQSPLPTGVMASGCLEQVIDQAPPWIIAYVEYPRCIWTEYALSSAPQVEQQRKGVTRRRH